MCSNVMQLDWSKVGGLLPYGRRIYLGLGEEGVWHLKSLILSPEIRLMPNSHLLTMPGTGRATFE